MARKRPLNTSRLTVEAADPALTPEAGLIISHVRSLAGQLVEADALGDDVRHRAISDELIDMGPLIAMQTTEAEVPRMRFDEAAMVADGYPD